MKPKTEPIHLPPPGSNPSVITEEEPIDLTGVRVGDVVYYRTDRGLLHPAIIQSRNADGSARLWIYGESSIHYQNVLPGRGIGFWMPRDEELADEALNTPKPKDLS